MSGNIVNFSTSASNSPQNKKDGSDTFRKNEQVSPKPVKDHANRKPHNGQGKYTYPNGDIYEGLYAEGLRHGTGVMVWAGGRQYRGGWERDKPHGRCEEVMPDRTTYKGEYEMGLRQGQGLEVTVYGDEYNGEWLKGLRHGVGDYFSDGLHYEGEWGNDKRC